MKNIWMAAITIVTVCCVVVGTLFHVGGFVSGGRFWGSTESTGSGLEAFHSVKVDADLMNVSVKEGSEFYLDCEYTDGLEPVYEVKDGILSIKQHKYRFRNWGFHNQQCSLSLTIPEGSRLESADISTALGDIDMDGIISSKCEIKTNAGNCTIKNCSFDDTEAGTNMGDVVINDSALRKVEADSDMGDIKVNGCTFGDLDASSALGDVKVSTSQKLGGYRMELGTDMGSVRVNGIDEGTKYHQSGDDGELELKTNMGSIKLDYE